MSDSPKNEAEASVIPHGEPGILRELLYLTKNASLAKYSHFSAATRSKNANTFVGLPALLISLFLGSVLFYSIGQEIPVWGKWAGGVLGFIAAGLTLCQTFFNFNHSFENHRQLANSYLELERKAQQSIRRWDDGMIKIQELDDHCVTLHDEYMEVNRSAEKYPTNQMDFRYARMKTQKWKGIGKHSFSRSNPVPPESNGEQE